jgi:choline dehydrogenase
MVDRILFKERRAVGVRLADSSEEISAQHVILAAGAYGSPAILMRSGIGPANHLKALRIPVLVDLPGVGQNLMEHPLFGLSFESPAPEHPEQEVPIFQTLLTLRSAHASKGCDLMILPTSITPFKTRRTLSGSFDLFVALMRPRSRGYLKLRSADPNAAPIIDLGFFTHHEDMPLIIEGVRAVRQLAKTPPLSKLIVKEMYPGPEVSEASKLEAAVTAGVGTYQHPVGTCRMGQDTKKGAVVNSQGYVHGVEGLSVIDASIMPVIPSANTNLPTIMIAERCSAWH